MRIQEHGQYVAGLNNIGAGRSKDASGVMDFFEPDGKPLTEEERAAKRSLSPMPVSTRLNSYNIPAADIAAEEDFEKRKTEIEAYMQREHGVEGTVQTRRTGTVPENYAVSFFNSANDNISNKIVIEIKFGEVMVVDVPKGFDLEDFDKFMEYDFKRLMDKHIFKKFDYEVAELESIFEEDLLRRYAPNKEE